MKHRFLSYLSLALVVAACLSGAAVAQSKTVLTGTVTDSAGAVLRGARIELQPIGLSTVTDAEGQFTFSGLTNGTYTVKASYVGFGTTEVAVNLEAGQFKHVDVALKVASVNEQLLVVAERPRGEAEVVNRMISADNILQVLPSEVITSLPNANIADALGRLPSVTIERDEGEGKYVQIRGTEPRLTNVTIDGINVPSPESGIRQIKLDVLASDLVESVEINKTLQANMDADGIGGSVNLRTKTADDTPTLTAYTNGGYTPIIGGRNVFQAGGTAGERFGAQKKLGVLFGGTWDYNGRGIDDIEPSPTFGSAVPHYDSLDLREYIYYRTRWGLSGSADYRLGQGSNVYIRGLYSTFQNWGNKWVWTLNDMDNPKASQDWRRPDFAIGNIVMGGRHQMTSSLFSWDLSVARSRSLNGSGGAKYKWAGPDVSATCYNDQSLAVSVYRPQWSASCFSTATGSALDPNNYKLSQFTLPPNGLSAQLNLQGSASYAKNYHTGSHYGIFEAGFKIRNGHKFDDTFQDVYTPMKGTPTVLMSQFLNNFTNNDYYDKSYQIGATPDWRSVRSFVLNSPNFDHSLDGKDGDYDFIERVTAGYLMNTIDLNSRLRLNAGVRFEATHLSTQSFILDPDGNITGVFKPGGDYLDVLPSVSLRIGLDQNSNLRLSYGRGLARPNPQDIAQPATFDNTQTPEVASFGNPNLKAEHADNFDVLYQRSLNPVGIITAGFFYKRLTDPIVYQQFIAQSGPYTGFQVTQPVNAGDAHVTGFEIGYQQRLSFLPSVMRYMGLSANYSYTQSKACKVLDGRSDCPALLRQAPNTWNISPTFDTKRFSMRLGMTYNDAMIYAYQWTDGADNVGIHGPAGDNYLYAHFQVDLQGSYKVYKGFQLYGYGLNLNNEVFGFYNGSPKYVVQREYYHPTFAGGLRYTFARE